MFRLVLVNLFRNPLRTYLTMASVTVALFLFCALGGILDTLQEAIKVGSESRLVVRNKISLVQWIPMAYRQRIEAVPGVKRVGVQNWFGGQDPNDTHGFFAQFAVDPVWFAVYNDEFAITQASPAQADVAIPQGANSKLAAYFAERNACVVGAKLLATKHWHVGQTINLAGTIFPGSWPFTIRAVYHAKRKSFGDETMFFHYDYLSEKGMGGQQPVGTFVLQLADPAQAGAIAHAIDAQFENSAPATLTETEQAFQAGFVSMYGNVPFVLRVVGLAIVFSILLIAANTMMTSVRERTTEVGVLKTLGFTDGSVFTMVVLEAAFITLGGGLLGALGAKLLVEGASLGAFFPNMSVYWGTVGTGVAIAFVIGAVSGLTPAVLASRLRIVDALRRVE